MQTTYLSRALVEWDLFISYALINDLYYGRRYLNPNIAIQFEKAFDLPAEYWMSFQTQYEIAKAKKKAKNIARIKNIEILKTIREYVPIDYLLKHRYLTEDHAVDIQKIKEIYSVNSVEELVSFFKQNKFVNNIKPGKSKINEKELYLWTFLAKYLTKNQTVNNFNSDNLKQLYKELNIIFFNNLNTIENVKSVFEQFGIKFVMIQEPKETPIIGFSFWSEKNPAIALTSKQYRIESFAFSIMYELAHIEKHILKKKNMFFLKLNKKGKKDNYESEADSYAHEILFPKACRDEIIKNYESLNDSKIIQIAEKYKINPVIILASILKGKKRYPIKTNIDNRLK